MTKQESLCYYPELITNYFMIGSAVNCNNSMEQTYGLDIRFHHVHGMYVLHMQQM